MEILCGYTVRIGGGDLLDFCLVAVQPVGGIAVELIGHALGQNLVGRVEAEDEGVQDLIFGVFDFVLGDRIFGKILDIFFDCLHGLDRALTLRGHRDLCDAGMPEVRANPSAHAVGEAALCANVIKEPRGEAAAEGLIEHADGVVVRIVALDSERDQVDAALVHVFFSHQVLSRRRRMVLHFIFGQRRAFGPRFECRAQLGFHRGGIEVAADTENDIVGLHVLAVPADQILSRHRRDRSVFRHARIGIVGAIRQLD